VDRPAADMTVSNESQQLIDMLKCQLQQAALVQQTSNMQLDAIKQVFTCCFEYHICVAVILLTFLYSYICSLHHTQESLL